MTDFNDFNLYHLAGYVLILLGLVGAILPLLPGPLLIWLGALVWAWGDGFVRVNWVLLAVLGVLAALAWASDILLTTAMSRRTGVSWKAIGGAIVGGILGGILLVEIPIIGTLFGALVGAMLGMLAVEWFDKRNLRQALRATWGYLVSSLLASALEIVIAGVMVGIFVWQVWL
jgi:uncharacterized protein YqgC (DUF456 family)